MFNFNKICNLIERGKQLGRSFYFERNGDSVWTSVAIQKHQNVYYIQVLEIYESDMASEEFIRDEIKEFASLQESLEFITENTQVNRTLGWRFTD